MALEKTWRWFGSGDAVTLAELRQMGVEGVVTSLHHIAAGEVWETADILAVKHEIERYGMRWSVVESLPVAEGIKICSPDRDRLVDNYRRSLRNLGACGIDTVCYNFMPVLDWARTDLHYRHPSGAESMLFDYPTFAAFDVFILRREGARDSYKPHILEKAERIIARMTADEQEELAHNIIIVTQAFIHGVTADGDDYKKQFLRYLDTYRQVGKDELRENLLRFLRDVVPTAEEAGVNLCIHPDDPPFTLLGLPRIAGTTDDFRWIFSRCPSLRNGLTFCTGSLSTNPDNNLILMAEEFASRIHFVHLRNTNALPDLSFCESGHLTGCVDMFSVVRVLLTEQIRRKNSGRRDVRMPFRPDHGLRMLDDFHRTANPGYPLVGRLKGLAEIDGLQTAIERFLTEGQH